MEKRLFVPELGREVVFDDSYPPEYVQNYIAQQVAAIGPKPRQEAPSFQPGNEMKGFLSGIPAGLVNAAADIPEGIGGILNSDTLKRLGRGIRESDVGKALTTGRPQEWQGTTGDTAGNVTGQLISMLVPGGALKLAKAPAALGTLQALLQASAQSSAQQVRDAQASRDAGMPVTPEQETDAARMGAAIAGPMGMLPYGRLLSRFAPAGLNIAKEAAGRSIPKIVGNALLSGGIEAGTEVGQDVIQDLIKRGVYNEAQPIGENAMASAKAGAGAGVSLDLLMSLLARGTGKRIMARREALPSMPVDALQDVDSIGVRRGEGGDPLVEMLAMLNQPQPEPMAAPVRPVRPVPGMPAPLMDDVLEVTDGGGRRATPKAMPGQPPPRIAELLPDVQLTPEGAVAVPSRLAMDQPRERFVAGEYAGPDVPTTEQAAQAKKAAAEARAYEALPLLDQVIQQPVESVPPKRPAPGMPPPKVTEGLPDATLTHEGAITTPSPLAMDQPGAPRFPLEPTTAAPTPYTVESLGQEIKAGKKPEIALDVFGEMQRLGVDDLLSTRLIDTIAGGKSAGTYGNRIVQLALEGKSKADLLRTLNHEAVHGMKQMGLFTDAEWSLLNSTFNPNNSLTEDERTQYAKLYNDPVKVNEEAIARGIEKYAAGQMDAPPEAVSVAARALGAVDRLGNVLRGKGFQNTGDVLKAFRSGGVGGRDVAIADGQAVKPVTGAAEDGKTGKRSTSLADYLDEDKAAEGEDVRHSVVPQLPVSGTTPFAKPDERSQLRKAIDTFIKPTGLGGAGLRGRQEVLDMRAGIAALGREAGDTSARTGSEAAVRNADVAQDFAAAAIKHGPLIFKGTQGDGHFEASGDTHIAPATVFKEAYQAGKLDRLFHYLAAERSDVLLSEGREKKISPADVAAWKAYGTDPEIADYAKRWRMFNDQMVDTLEKSGRIDAMTASKFKKDMYIPYYRVEANDDGSINFQSSGATLTSNPRLTRLKGSDLNIADPTDNIVRNINTLTSMAMKNEAMQRVVRDGLQTGYIRQVPKPIAGKPNVKVWVGGKEKHFEVDDPILYESMNASRIPSSTALTIAGFPAKVLRESVTMDPVFMVNNMARDATAVWLHGYTDFPLQKVFKDAASALANRPSFQKLEKAGVIGNSIRGEGGASGTGKNLRDLYEGKQPIIRNLEEFSRKSEAINRMTVYDAVLKRTGGDEAQAQYEARELLNFNRRGAHPVVQWVNALIPFQNAAWQGADVAYRTARGHGSNPQMQKQFRNRMAALAGLSVGYTIMASGMKEWQNASKEERDNNWFLPGGVKVKIPFEAGYVAKVIPERLTAMYLEHDTGKEFIESFGRFLASTLKADIVPQSLAPAGEVAVNYSRFRGRSIEPEYMRGTEKGQRFDENTSELAKKIGEHTDVLSPLQIDHLLRGYLGTMGLYGEQLSGLIVNPDKAASSLSLVERKPHEIPVLGRFFQREDGPGELIKAYDMGDKGKQAKTALKAGAEPTPERVALAEYERGSRATMTQMSAITKQEKAVRAAMSTGAMKPEEARPLLREYRAAKIALAKEANKASKPLR